jgi:purine-binding chemotaxis protein CheW
MNIVEGNAVRNSPLPAAEEGKFLTFRLAGEEYGIGILKVREIVGMTPVTRVPNLPPHIKGVINLRGRVIPVLDLRLRFRMDASEYDERTCIVVVELDVGNGVFPTGLIVDSVSEVLNIKKRNIERPPSFGASFDTSFILGMANMDEGVKILLDIDNVLNPEEKAPISEIAS